MPHAIRAAFLATILTFAPAVGRPAERFPPEPAGAWFRDDAIEIRLAPWASRRAVSLRRATRATGAARSIGIESVERSLAGARFEALFPADDPPPAGSEAPDLAAYYRVMLAPGESVEQALARLRASPEVASAEPIALLPVSLFPNDSLWSVSTWFYQSSRRDIHAPEAWNLTAGDTSVVIAVLDTGVLPWHPDLGGTFGGAGNLWRNAAEVNGVAGEDDDRNGYNDDVAGWDFVSLVTSAQAAPGEDWSDEDPDPSDFAGHGTLVASLAAGITDNGIGGAGTAFRSRILPLRIGWSAPSAPNGLVDMSYAASAIRYATRAGASVINCSFETTNTGSLLAAAAAATRAGVVIVNAAGNGTTDIALAQREDVISVAASDPNDVIAGFSNVGTYVDLAAPGVGITGASVTHGAADSIGQRTPAYATFSGTSFSAPMVSGAAALVVARQRDLGLPRLHPMDVLFRLRETSDDISAANPGGSGYGTGRLNLERAVTETHTSRVVPMGARNIGSPVVLRTRSGGARIALVTFNSRLLVLRAPGGDTLVNVTLPGRPARQLAAADLGGGRGIGLFVGCVNGKLAGYDLAGNVLPGWPVAAPSPFTSFIAGPALGDLDGDGVLEVVCGGSDGALYAWDAGGNPLANFPIPTGATALSVPVALSDVDGVPGVEIAMVATEGWVAVYHFDGSQPPGWPQLVSSPPPSSAPIVGQLGPGNPASIFFGRGASIQARNPDGTQRFNLPLAVSITQEPVLADVDGDGFVELVAAGSQSSTHQLTVVDSTGSVRSGAGWPQTLGAAVNGGPLVGPLRAGGLRGILVPTAGGLAASTDSAKSIRTFPKPGLAGATSTLADLDGSGHTIAVATPGPDSLLYLYDAGPGTWGNASGTWLTSRANFARTGSALYSPPLPELDDVPPATISDLEPDSVGPTAIALRWSAPGDDGLAGTASAYELQVTTLKGEAGTFAGSGVSRDLAPPAAAGTLQRALLTGLAPGTAYYCALRARDAAGNWGGSSPVVTIVTPLGGAGRDTADASLRAVASPGPVPLAIRWRAALAERGAQHALELFDVTGRRVRRVGLGIAAGGIATWDGRDDEGRPLGAGLYFVRLGGGSIRTGTRVVVLR